MSATTDPLHTAVSMLVPVGQYRENVRPLASLISSGGTLGPFCRSCILCRLSPSPFPMSDEPPIRTSDTVACGRTMQSESIAVRETAAGGFVSAETKPLMAFSA
eukprot:scaffold7033_cov257-Pinguiococcus_pyrenoidosus.AAC.3